MTAQDNAALVQAFDDAYNGRDIDAALAMTTADAEFVIVPTGQTFHGHAGVRQYFEGWMTAFPDSQIERTSLVADEQGAAQEFTGRGTQTGPLQTPAGAIPPTGQRVEVPFCQILEIRQGQIARLRLYFDVGGLLQQLGVLPSPPSATA